VPTNPFGSRAGFVLLSLSCRLVHRTVGTLRFAHPTDPALVALYYMKENHVLTLYFAPGASSMAVHIALHEIGVDFEAKPMSFKNNDMHSPDFLKLNPEGKVPVLLIDDRPLTEVAAILLYLARRFPDAKLLPDGDIEAEAQVISWMSFIASTLHPARQRGLDYARTVYGIADRRLGGSWALGDHYSIADIHLFRLYWRLYNSLKPAPGTFPNLDAHYARMMARPAVQQTIAVEAAIGYELPA
jgi:glutathione S-transferase